MANKRVKQPTRVVVVNDDGAAAAAAATATRDGGTATAAAAEPLAAIGTNADIVECPQNFENQGSSFNETSQKRSK